MAWMAWEPLEHPGQEVLVDAGQEEAELQAAQRWASEGLVEGVCLAMACQQWLLQAAWLELLTHASCC